MNPSETSPGQPATEAVVSGSSEKLTVAISGHKAESERLGHLTCFLANFAPVPGETVEPGRDLVDDETTPQIRQAREQAILEAFRAVARIASNSFIPGA